MATVGRRAYDLMYRFGAPWERADRGELRALVRDGTCSPERLRRPGTAIARAIDLGSGAGGVSLELAEAGFEVTGVDFSPVARRKAEAEAARRGLGPDRVRFVEGDLTAGHVAGVDGPFDLLVDYGTIDDLPNEGRRRMAAYVSGLARPGAKLFLFAFAGEPQELPMMSFGGPSRAFPGLVPGEVERLFEPTFQVTPIQQPTRQAPFGTWLLERTTAPAPTLAIDPSPEVSAMPWSIRRAAGPLLIVASVLSAVSLAALIAMFAAFAIGAQAAGMSFGFVNDVLGLVTSLLVLPGVVALHERLAGRWRTRDRALLALGLGSFAAVAVLQALLVTEVLTSEQQLGPVLVAYLGLAVWLITTGRMASRRGLVPHGTRLGVLAALYVGFPVWAYRVGRLVAAPSTVAAASPAARRMA
jgi:SAM-dependent methyltransferase